ncbi:MAG: helix-turn-helix domain-containing protein [Rhizomicrobium sp.]
MMHHGAIRLILAAVATVYGLDPKSLRTRNACHAVSHPRQVAALLARTLTDQTLPQIAHQLGYIDHTTVLYGQRAAERRMMADPVLAGTVADLARIVTGMDRFSWPPNLRTPFLTLANLADNTHRPPHDVAAALRHALTDEKRLAEAGFPPRRPPAAPPAAPHTAHTSRCATEAAPLPILQFIETHPARTTLKAMTMRDGSKAGSARTDGATCADQHTRTAGTNLMAAVQSTRNTTSKTASLKTHLVPDGDAP